MQSKTSLKNQTFAMLYQRSANWITRSARFYVWWEYMFLVGYSEFYINPGQAEKYVWLQ